VGFVGCSNLRVVWRDVGTVRGGRTPTARVNVKERWRGARSGGSTKSKRRETAHRGSVAANRKNRARPTGRKARQVANTGLNLEEAQTVRKKNSSALSQPIVTLEVLPDVSGGGKNQSPFILGREGEAIKSLAAKDSSC